MLPAAKGPKEHARTVHTYKPRVNDTSLKSVYSVPQVGRNPLDSQPKDIFTRERFTHNSVCARCFRSLRLQQAPQPKRITSATSTVEACRPVAPVGQCPPRSLACGCAQRPRKDNRKTFPDWKRKMNLCLKKRLDSALLL